MFSSMTLHVDVSIRAKEEGPNCSLIRKRSKEVMKVFERDGRVWIRDD